MEAIKLRAAQISQIKSKFKSKADFHWYLTKKTQTKHYLPPLDNLCLSFVQDILSGERLLLDAEKVSQLPIPDFKEFSVTQLYAMFAADAQVLLHLPDPNKQERQVNREFAYKVAATLRPNYIKAVFDAAYAARDIPSENKLQSKQPKICDKMMNVLLEQPYNSRKSGRAFAQIVRSFDAQKRKKRVHRKFNWSLKPEEFKGGKKAEMPLAVEKQ